MSARRRALALVGTTSLVLLAACGGGGGEEGSSSTVEPSGWGVASADPSEDDGDPAPTTEPGTMEGMGGDKPDPESTTTTTAPTVDDAEAVACQVLTASLLQPVTLDEPEPSDDEESRAEIEALADTLATSGPEILRPGATRLQELIPLLYEADPEAPTPEEEAGADEVLELMGNLLAWTGSTCELDVMAWACPTHTSFHPVGQPIDGGPEDTSSPEAVAAHHEPGAVEADRTEDVVLFAWVDDHDMVVRTLEVDREGDAWAAGTSSECAGL